MKYKITPRHFSKFKKFCLKWQRYFNLLSWEITIHDPEKDDDNRAETYINPQGRIADIYISTQWDHCKPTDEALELVAFHEMCEVLLFPLGLLGTYYCNKNMVEKETHIIIKVLENTILKGRLA